MRSDFINEDADIKASEMCFYDSNIGFATDFNRNGDVDSWTYFDGIYTYGCWGGFLFGTLYGKTATVGRYNTFPPVDCSKHYFIKIVMKYNAVTRIREQQLPAFSKLYWRTLSDTNWSEAKSKTFDLKADNNWHTYVINMGEAQYWQGNANDLRLVVATDNGLDGDEFFIRSITIFSIDQYVCTNPSCDYYTRFTHNCIGVGDRPALISIEHPKDYVFNIEADSEIYLNINNYGYEKFSTPEIKNASGYLTAFALTRLFAEVNVGGYAESRVVYEDNKFKIYCGTYTSNSTIEILDSPTARLLGFFNHLGQSIYTTISGRNSATGFTPLCSYKARTQELLNLFDSSSRSYLNFNPFIYNIEGGRFDWAGNLGMTSYAIGPAEELDGIPPQRRYYQIENDGRTIIDFTNPFNASGRISKLFASISLDPPDGLPWNTNISGTLYRYQDEAIRILMELHDAKFLIIRPKKNGLMEIVHEIPIPNRIRGTGKLYSTTQESIDLDVDLFVNRGDLLGVYNAHVYAGKSVTGNEVDAQYFQITGKPSGIFDPGKLHGQGSSGLLMYSRSSTIQKRLVVDIDLRRRYNIDSILINGIPYNQILYYNLCRCLDMSQFVGETFGLMHYTMHKTLIYPGTFVYQRPNTMYGLNRLTDGITTIKDGYAADSFSITGNWTGNKDIYFVEDAGPGVIPNNPQYFWINGDEEWLAMHLHNAWWMCSHNADGFDSDKFALTIYFPLSKNKNISKSVIYFKDQYNCRSFALSTFGGDFYSLGNADNNKFDLIPAYTRIKLDDTIYEPGSPLYDRVDKYLFVNPSIGQPIIKRTSTVLWQNMDNGRWEYMTNNIIDNYDQNTQAQNTDWRTITHEWEPIAAKGFRFFCDYHKSTKIAEIEVYGETKDVGSNMSGGINLLFSDYGDVWWAPEGTEIEEGKTEFIIGDTPRYIQVEFVPVTEIKYSDVIFNVNTKDFFAGAKGCEYEYFTDNAKKGSTSASQVIEFKNIYETAYDLYVDIPPETLDKSGLIFYSSLVDQNSVFNPEVGPDATYIKEDDYPLTFKGRNCAINCHCWGLRNLVDGNHGYYKKSEIAALHDLGTLTQGQIINYTNVGGNRSVLKIPILSRNRYWKIAGKTPNVKANVRELSVLRNNEKLDADFYYEVGESRYIDLCFNGVPSCNTGTSNNAFDKDDTTYWEPSIPAGSWLSYTFLTPTLVQAFSLKSPEIRYVPHTFALQASISGTFTGSDLIDLAVFNSDIYSAYSYDTYVCTPNFEYNTTTGFMEFTYDFSNNIVPYRYYRLFIETNEYDNYNTNGTGGIRITEFKLLRPTAYRDFYTKPLERLAPHIENESVTGSYYQIHKNNCIGFDLGAQKEIDTLEFYHDVINEVETEIYYFCTDPRCEGQRRSFYDTFCGIDIATWIYINGEGDRNNSIIKDGSYYEHPLTLGSGVVKENDNDTFDISYSMSETFSNCSSLTDWFSSDGARFSCVSGTPNYLSFNFRGSPGNGSGYYKSLRTVIGDASKRFCVDETTAFRARFKISFDDFYMDYEGSGRYGHMVVGLVGTRSGAYASMLGGVKVYFGTGEYSYQRYASLSVMDHNHAGYSYDYYPKGATIIPTASGALDINTPYYVEITGDGNYNYTAKIWTDDWNGSVLKGSTSIRCYSKIRAYEFGVYFESGSLKNIGKIYEMHIDYLERETSKEQVGGSISFNGAGSLTVPNNYGIILRGKQFEVDFYVMFERLPLSGMPIALCRVKDNSFAITAEYSSGSYLIRLSATGVGSSWTMGFAPCVGTWHHISVCTSYYNSTTTNYSICIDGKSGPYYNFNQNNFANYTLYDFEIGNNLVGLISNFRLSSDNNTNANRGYPRTGIPLPTKKYENRFSFSIYCSADNVSYGKYADVDLFNGYTNVYYNPECILSSFYNSYFYVNMGQRHCLDIVRNYGTASAYQITKDKFLSYSKTQTDNFDEVNFKYAEDVSDDFSTGLKPDTFLWSYTDNADMYLDLGRLRIKNNGTTRVTQELKSKYAFVGDFDIQIDYQISFGGGTGYAGLFIEDVVTSGIVGVQRRYDSTYQHSYYATTQTDAMVFYRPTTETIGTLRLRRRGQSINAYYKKGLEWDLVHQWVGWSFNDVRVRLKTYTTLSLETHLDNFIVNLGEPVYLEGYKDAQWARVNLPNGDGTTRTIYKLGIYPEISVNVSPSGDKHNTYWDYLGPSVTDYTEGTNFALTATVSGSSYTEGMYLSNINDGYFGETLQDSWGSGNEKPTWVSFDLGEIKSIYRVKIYHGFTPNSTDILAQDYRVQVSNDGINYTTLFDITNNTSLERTHDLAQPISTRYVRVWISAYKTSEIYIKAGESFIYFKGVCIREVQIFGYYGYPIISSEQYPILGINLRKQFFLAQDHTLVGVDAESTTTNWSGTAGAYAYSDNPFDNPEGVVFRPFGSAPIYDQWVAIKQNTATSYDNGPDYLKNAIIRADQTPNPCDYYWWWASDISTISRGYNDVVFSVFPVQIDYPASTATDTVYTRSGDNFGVDSVISWRDGVNFRIHIDDISNFDLDFGYFFIKGTDGTSTAAPIEHRWNFSTLSGVLVTGWSAPFLQFKYADDVIYDETTFGRFGENPLCLDKITFTSFGMVFRGKGAAMKLYIDGTVIGRNHFESYSQYGQGLYLKGNDVLTAPIGEFNPNFGTIEFWFRPDYTFTGGDYLQRYKNRSIFHFGNSSGDILGMCVGGQGVILYYGHTYDLRALNIAGLSVIPLDSLMHIGVVYSANGLSTGDNTTIKLFVNNQLVGYTTDKWSVSDTKLFKFLFGGQALLGVKEGTASYVSSSVDAVISRLKIYNYCKTDFNSSMAGVLDDEMADNLIKPSKLIEISKDNLTFYKVGDSALPFIFEKVAPGSTVQVYFRTVLPINLTGAEKRVSAIVGSWDIGV